MSIILKKIIHLLILFSSFYCFSQVHSEKKEIMVYFDIKDKAINSYFVKKDSSEATFSVFLKGFEQKKARDKTMKDYKNEIGDPNSIGPPSFTISFISFSKPEKLKTIKETKYLTIDEFRNKLFPQGYPMYFIYKSRDGYYLKWKVIHIEY